MFLTGVLLGTELVVGDRASCWGQSSPLGTELACGGQSLLMETELAVGDRARRWGQSLLSKSFPSLSAFSQVLRLRRQLPEFLLHKKTFCPLSSGINAKDRLFPPWRAIYGYPG